MEHGAEDARQRKIRGCRRLPRARAGAAMPPRTFGQARSACASEYLPPNRTVAFGDFDDIKYGTRSAAGRPLRRAAR